MKRLAWLGFALLSITAVASATGCDKNPVGRRCVIGGSVDETSVSSETIVASPAVDCQSFVCLHMAERSPDMCTARCETDDDCDTEPNSPCSRGFVCMKPTVVGKFCCEKLCVCRDYVNLEPGEAAVEPAECDPANPINECCNLQGRREDSTQYPQCVE